jgi:predicted lipid carrier protein YhbT
MRAAPALITRALKPLPLWPLQIALSALLGAIVERHPGIFDRLGAHAGKRYGIDPTDMPFALELRSHPDRPRIIVLRHLAEDRLDASIAGPLALLVGLAGGRLDGDALFFSRDLVVEGDIAAVVALRNAIDDNSIDLLAAALACLGPLGAPVRRALNPAVSMASELSRAFRWN